MKKTFVALIVTLVFGLTVFAQIPRPPRKRQPVDVISDTTLTDSSMQDSLEIEAEIFVPPDSTILIPAGQYEIGYNKGLPDQKPVRLVTVRAFYLDNHEVTNAQYSAFLDSTGHRLPIYWQDSLYNDPDMPVVGVSWYDAEAYCKWAGKRLPTEAEWEIAARGGLKDEKFPFEGRINSDKVNYHYDDYNDPEGLKIAGQYPPNGYGLYDMAGNVWEWTADWYRQTAYQDTTDLDSPSGPAKGQARVIRGGSWNYIADFQTVYYRNRAAPEMKVNYIGFRCAKDAE